MMSKWYRISMVAVFIVSSGCIFLTAQEGRVNKPKNAQYESASLAVKKNLQHIKQLKSSFQGGTDAFLDKVAVIKKDLDVVAGEHDKNLIDAAWRSWFENLVTGFVQAIDRAQTAFELDALGKSANKVTLFIKKRFPKMVKPEESFCALEKESKELVKLFDLWSNLRQMFEKGAFLNEKFLPSLVSFVNRAKRTKIAFLKDKARSVLNDALRMYKDTQRLKELTNIKSKFEAAEQEYRSKGALTMSKQKAYGLLDQALAASKKIKLGPEAGQLYDAIIETSDKVAKQFNKEIKNQEHLLEVAQMNKKSLDEMIIQKKEDVLRVRALFMFAVEALEKVTLKQFASEKNRLLVALADRAVYWGNPDLRKIYRKVKKFGNEAKTSVLPSVNFMPHFVSKIQEINKALGKIQTKKASIYGDYWKKLLNGGLRLRVAEILLKEPQMYSLKKTIKDAAKAIQTFLAVQPEDLALKIKAEHEKAGFKNRVDKWLGGATGRFITLIDELPKEKGSIVKRSEATSKLDKAEQLIDGMKKMMPFSKLKQESVEKLIDKYKNKLENKKRQLSKIGATIPTLQSASE